MRFLLDECIPQRLTEYLRSAGHDCLHIYDLGVGGHSDQAIMDTAASQRRILISADTDFGELLANSLVLAPSLVLVRRTDKRAEPLATVILANLGQLADDLAAGALVVIGESRIRTRRLPVNPGS